MRKIFLIILAVQIMPMFAEANTNSGPIIEKEVIYCNNPELSGYLAMPTGEGPFPAVIYNHGGFEDMIGGAPKETAQELAKAGYVGFSPIRRKEMSMEGNFQDILTATEYLKGLKEIDTNRIAIMGFSRGGLLTLLTAIKRSEWKAIVVMAPAPGKGHIQEIFQQIEKISAPVLLLVAENDNKQADHVEICQKLEQSLRSNAKEAKLIIYPAFASDGHKMFFEIGAYWQDVLEFLEKYLKNEVNTIYIPEDLDKCFVELKSIFNPQQLEEVKSKKEEEIMLYHQSIGRWIRNNWIHRDNSKLKVYFNNLGIFHPDHMSGIILTSFHRHLNNKAIMLKEQVQFYKDYWENGHKPVQ